MNGVMKRTEGSYCPISVSDMATSNAKVRQTSLREYAHAQNAAYRAYCRGPGRPQTAAFGRVYFESPRNHPSVSPPDTTNLRDCIVASKATVEEQRDDVTNHYAVNALSPVSQPNYTKRRFFSRTKTARRTLQHLAEELSDEIATRIAGSEQPVEDTVCVKNKETDDVMIELDSGSDEKRSDAETSDEINNMTPSEDFDRQLTVYHFVDSGCPCTTTVSDPTVGCRACSCVQQFVVSSYTVEMQGEGYHSTPGLGNCDSQENKYLWDLLQKQLSLVCY